VPSRRGLLLASAGLLLGGGSLRSAPAFEKLPPADELRRRDPMFWKLVDVLNAYRQTQGLEAVPLSSALSAVAALHARDVARAKPHEKGRSLHSWSEDPRWKGGEYKTGDKTTWSIMWEKPKEIAGYAGIGFEISAAEVKGFAHALRVWQGSQVHHDVILNRGLWAKMKWRALGAALIDGCACAWFGEQ